MSHLNLSVFHSVFYPFKTQLPETEQVHELRLRRSIRFRIPDTRSFREYPMVVFDFETTGLDANRDRIIEIGAIRYENFQAQKEYSTLLATKEPLSESVQRLTGIRPDMLVGMPTLEQALPEFLQFIEGALLIAHNASFDWAFLKNECLRQGIDMEWPVFCTLKMAREYLAHLEKKGLDSLAVHYGLKFEARHRSIGDVKVTHSILESLLHNEGAHLETWSDLSSFRVS